MYGNQYRYGVEVANDETLVFESVAIVNEPYELMPLMHSHDHFKVVVYRQDDKGIYHRSDDFIAVDFDGMTVVERQHELIKQLNLLSDKA